MAIAKPRAEKPIPEMNDKLLGQHIARGRKKLAELVALEVSSQELRAGKGEEILAEARAVRATVEAAEAERSRRQARPDTETIGLRLRARRAMEERRRKPHPAKDVIGKIARFAHPELVGWQPDIYRLTAEEGQELVALVRRKWAASEQPGAEPLTAKQEKRYEKLVGKVAGNEGLFTEKRKQADEQAKIAEGKELLRLAALPPRPKFAEPGSVQLPRYVFEFLGSARKRRGAFSIADLGMLAAMLGMFWNKQVLFIGGRFITEDDEPVLVLREEELRFPTPLGGSAMMSDGSGFVRERAALRVLARNGFFQVERSGSDIRIRLGERGKALGPNP
jgi:hypothetical protein